MTAQKGMSAPVAASFLSAVGVVLGATATAYALGYALVRWYGR